MVFCRFHSYFTFIAKEKLHFLSICSFYCCLVKGGWALKVAYQFAMWVLVAYKLVAYKNIKCSKSIPGFSISRLANVKDFFNLNIFLEYKYVRINDYSFEFVCVVCCLKIRFYFLTCSAESNLNSADFTTPNSHQRFQIEMILEFKNKANIEIIRF